LQLDMIINGGWWVWARLYRREYLFVCDTSFLIALVEKKLFGQMIERYRPLKLLIPESVMQEISRFPRSGGKYMKIKALYKMMEIHKDLFKTVPSKSFKPDKDVLEVAKEVDGIVATCDGEVRRRAKESGLKTMFILDSKLYIN